MDCNKEVARILREELAERFYLIGALVTPDKAESIDHEVDTVVCDSVRLCERLAGSLETGEVPEPGPSDLSEPQFNAEVLKRLSEGYDLVPHRELGLLAKELARGRGEAREVPQEESQSPDPERSYQVHLIGAPGEHKLEPPGAVRWLREDMPALLWLTADGLTEGDEEHRTALVHLLDDVRRYAEACAEAVAEQRPVLVAVEGDPAEIADQTMDLARVLAAQNLNSGTSNAEVQYGFELVAEFLLLRLQDQPPAERVSA